MKWVLIGIIAILVLIILILLLKLRIKIDILHSQDNDHIKITAKALFGLISYTYNVPLVKLDKESASLIVKSEQNLGNNDDNKEITNNKRKKITPHLMIEKLKKAKELLEHVVHFHVIVKNFFQHVTIHKFDWMSSVGVGDAAHTGVAIGMIWSLKGGIVGLLSKYMKLESYPKLSVTPHFQEKISHTRLICIISFRIGHATYAALSVIKYWKSIKGGRQHVGTSNPRLNDNSYGKLEAND